MFIASAPEAMQKLNRLNKLRDKAMRSVNIIEYSIKMRVKTRIP